MLRCAVAAVAIVGAANTVAAQQGSVQLSSSTQVVAASDERRAGQQTFEPDLGFSTYQPAFRFGTLFVDVHAVRRGDRARLGTASLGLRDVKGGGLTWSLTGGDTSVMPSLSAYAYTNLFAPQVTFAGGNLAGFGPRGSISVTAGRVTALRNIFGSDPQAAGQDMGQLNAKARPWSRLELFAHASRVRARGSQSFTTFVDSGADAGAGARVRPIPTIELTADAGLSWYRRRGSAARERNTDALVGAKWSLPRGWLELNAQRFSPGYFAVINSPYLDREGAFAAGEFVMAAPLRIFGGVEAYRTNLDPDASAAATIALPRGLTQRAFAGARVHVGGRNFVTLRAEQGDRTARPVIGRPGSPYDSDTGVTTVEFQTATREITAFARYERRENLDHANGSGTYTQQTTSAQLFGTVAPRVQLFGSAMLIDQARETGGQTFWQGGGGIQVQLPRRQLWLRAEGLLSRTDEWGGDSSVPHELYTVGLTGQVTLRTAVAFDLMLDRAPQLSTRASPWLGRSMIRLTHTLPVGSARVGATGLTAARRRGRASVAGSAFADWNGNGVRDAGEDPIAGVPFFFAEGTAAAPSSATVQVVTGRDGQFAFVNVPEGRATIGLDLSVLPVDYDAPDPAARETEVRGKAGEPIAFGLVPLGSISGGVWQDTNSDGVRGPEDTPVEDAVLVLDDGERSEQTRAGGFRFDAVRAGAHTVKLLIESLPEGASLAGPAQTDVVLERSRLHAATGFLVKLEKRKEIRKVFPQGSAEVPRGRQVPEVRGVTQGRGVPRGRGIPQGRQVPGVRQVSGGQATVAPGGQRTWYALQLAALRDRGKAWAAIVALRAGGVEAYLSEAGDGFWRVRVGSYDTRQQAEETMAKLRQSRPEIEAWIASVIRR